MSMCTHIHTNGLTKIEHMTNLQAGNGTFIHRSENKRENENKIRKKNSSDKK